MIPLLLHPLGKSNEAFGKVHNGLPLSKKQFAFDYGSRRRVQGAGNGLKFISLLEPCALCREP
jgi:hypothetical protein